MSLHIDLIKSENKYRQLELAIAFISFFNLIVNKLKIKVNGDVIHEEQLKGIDKNKLIKIIDSNIDNKESLHIQFLFNLNSHIGYLNINNNYDSNIFGNIEANIFPDKISNSNINNFFDLLRHNIINKDNLDKFFVNHKQILSKAYIDINEEGGDNPFDILYEYGTTGYNFFMKLFKAVELLSEENQDFLDLYTKLRSSDKNYFSSLLWHDDKIRDYAFKIANENNIVAQVGSFRLYADNKVQLKKSYKEMAEKILNPIFMEIPSMEEQVKKVSSNLPNQ